MCQSSKKCEDAAQKLSAPKSQRFLRFAIARPHCRPQKSLRFPRQEKAMLHCDLRVRWKVTSDLRFRAAISGPKTPSSCRISGDLAPSTRKSLAIAIVRFWCAKRKRVAIQVNMCGTVRPDMWLCQKSEIAKPRIWKPRVAINCHPHPPHPALRNLPLQISTLLCTPRLRGPQMGGQIRRG